MGESNRLKVLVLDNSLDVTGGFTSIYIVSCSIQNKVETVFVLPKGSKCSVILQESGFKVYELPFIELSRRISDILLYLPMLLINAWRVNRIVYNEKIIVVHTNDLYNLCSYASRLFGMTRPIVTHIRMMPASFPRIIYNFWVQLHLKLADKIICVSEAVGRSFRQSTKTAVIFGRVNVQEKYEYVSLRETDIANDKSISLLYLANYMQGKGQDHAIEAFKTAYEENKSLRLVFVGGDMGLSKNKNYREALMQKVNEYQLDHVVTFKDKTSDPEKEIKSHHIALNFSESESFSLTCLEALYYGTPLIATDCGGPAELFENGCSGILVPVKDILQMRDAILLLASDDKLRKKFSEEGRKYVIKKFIQNDTASKLKNIYFQLASTSTIR